MSNLDTFVKDNAKWLIGLVFFAGLAYGEIKNVRNVESRLNKKIKIISELEDDINTIKTELEILKIKINGK